MTRLDLLIIAAGFTLGAILGVRAAHEWREFVNRLGELGCIDEEAL